VTREAPDIYDIALRAFRGASLRSRDALVPPAFQFLWEPKRFIVAYGGRASAKSWSVARTLLVRGTEEKHLILCARESQSSIKESSYRLLCAQVRALDLEDFYAIGADKLTGRNGTEIIFEGLFRNAERLKSYEGVSLVWVEEAHRVSERSWEDFVPTIRKAGSQIYITFNPSQADDPVWQRFVASERPEVVARRVSWRDNPFLSAESIAEKDWCAATDIDQYRHVWEGEFRTVTEAQILRGKYVSQTFDVDPRWSGPHYGLDFGFSQDPTAGTACYIDDEERVLYVAREFWKLGCDIDALPDALEAAMPGVGDHTVYCDSARPESISYLARHGVPRARPAEKWSGSVDDGIAYLRSFSRIVIHADCQHTLDEANRYSFRVDRLTGVPLPEPEDKHNHLIDSLRYGLSPLIRNQPSGGYFSRAALLDRGDPVEGYGTSRPQMVFATAALSDRPGGAVGFAFWCLSPHHGHYLVLLDYDLAEVDEACSAQRLGRVFARLAELREEWRPLEAGAALYAEEGELYDALAPAVLELSEQLAAAELPFLRIESESLPAGSLDDRAAAVRTPVNSGTFVKFARSAYSRQATHRSVTANHLVSQVLGYRPGAGAPRELAAAFVFGCCVSYDRHRRPPVEAAALVPIAAPEAERADARAEADAATLRRQAFERDVAEWQAEYDAALDAARRRLGNPGWQPRCPQQIGVRPRPLPGFPLAVGG